MRSLAYAPRKETCSPLALQPTTHSFSLPRSPVHEGAAEATPTARPEAAGKRLRLCTGTHFGLSSYLSKVASPLTDFCISTATSRRPASGCPHSDRTQPSYRVWQFGRPGPKVNHLLGSVHGAKATAGEVAGVETTRTARVSGCKGRAGLSLQSRRSIGSLSQAAH